MVHIVEIIGNEVVDIEILLLQLSPKDKHVMFEPAQIELLGQKVFRWIIDVSLVHPTLFSLWFFQKCLL